MSESGNKSLHNLGKSPVGPTLVTAFALIVLVAVALFRVGGDPLALARLGTRYSRGDPTGTEGYDGQFVYYIARDLAPTKVSPLLDVPPYRYQRILLPLLARIISGGGEQILPWALLGIGVIAQTLGTWLVAILLVRYQANPWIALSYGLWAGFTLSVMVDLPEPLAYALVAGALLASENQNEKLAVLLFGLSLFAKEVTILFMGAYLGYRVLNRQWRKAGMGFLGTVPFLVFQGWLWMTFGAPGIGSGGANATPFEWIPFMGLGRIAGFDLRIFLVFLLVFGPTIVLPSVWGLVVAFKKIRYREFGLLPLILIVNALLIPFLPFSTFREPGGLLRFACGLLLAVLLYAARYKQKRVLNYSLFLLALNVFLIE